ncbi:sushi, von Willebrand factor type A, EGF and pentraxin domain-containing protein 1-like isoform X1 [Diorhabda carinulata]|uniref:sushi, von Willebrand factor type A, EGF and pentraxin domain-containing protein 1-like isoform X1 n=1 Tax=Diorhabda carinulata TaxID=1163345 RepID=UPI0025A1B88B|nr:sushi, von Willebrand factor type A, EGF and pentraxin domain-containing protein 1-like isoform X1 [Diorhabda carinulata]
MTNNIILVILISFIIVITTAFSENFIDDFTNNSEFLNFGRKKLYSSDKINSDSESKSKIDILGDILKIQTDSIKNFTKLDIIFLIDASSSVGENNFKNELKFVKKLLSDVIVDYNHTRVAVVTFSSPTNIYKNIDQIGRVAQNYNKCVLLNRHLKEVKYRGGETYTLGAFQKAKEIINASNRTDSKKVIFLITDGYSNGGDPVPVATELKLNSVIIFTIGIKNGNYKELYDISSTPGQFYSYLLDSFNEFESLARRALHSDLKHGDYIPVGYNFACNELCRESGDCCDEKAMCTCGTSTGHYACVCKAGYYGSGLKNNCFPCEPGTYSDGPNICLPCPDQFHTTISPAYGIDSCICKEGYKATGNGECKELKCMKIIAPEHGYYVKNRMCPNVIFSACGIRCEVGYNLKGTSVRLCQKNGTWSGTDPSCEIKTCNQLDIPKGGKMQCFQTDTQKEFNQNMTELPVDTSCKFSCDEGHILTGSKERICLPISRWSGLRTLCRPIKCKKLIPISFGDIEPASCKVGKQEMGKTCRIRCDEGFKIEGPEEKHCSTENGNWDSKFESTTCIDITPPVIVCPKNVIVNSLPGKKYGHISWEAPSVTDNSKLNVSSWMSPAVSDIKKAKFEIGTTRITYFAQDAFKNRANCSFEVTIKDMEPPIIESCVDPPTFLTGDTNGANISWDEPIAFDNSQIVSMNRSHEFGFFPIGTTVVTYIASDNSNNTSSCKLNITVEVSKCEPLPDPPNGQSKCTQHIEGIRCVITCEEGYSIPISDIAEKGNDTLFLCNNFNPVWYGQDDFFPECSVTQIPEEVHTGEVVFSDHESCSDTQSTETVKNDVKLFLSEKFCTENCTVDTQVECYNEIQKMAKTKRYIQNDENLHNQRQRHKKRVKVKFQLKHGYGHTKKKPSPDSKVEFKNGRQVTLHYQTKLICSNGSIQRGKRCVHCPRGTFHNATRSTCQSCPFGQYNNKTGEMSCSHCPEHYSTGRKRSKKITDCKEMCPPGTHARKKLQRTYKHFHNATFEKTTLKPFCTKCGVGYFQPGYGELKCIQCPDGYTTTSIGATNIEQCIPTAEKICQSDICNNGTCLTINNYEYTCNCSSDYIGTHCEKGIDSCQSKPCYNDGSCIDKTDGFDCSCKDGYTGKYCEESIEICDKTCLNNAVCYLEDNGTQSCLCPPEFTGDFCEIEVDFCEINYCENNGTCLNRIDQFRCKCVGGFIGLRCHILPCDYKPCENSKMCINIPEDNATRDSYMCVCPDGYTGKNCDELINNCLKNPCLNGGTCNNDLTTYSCTCSSLYFGKNCEFKRNTEYTFNFNEYSVTNYIKLKPLSQNLTEITVCLWVQTLDEVNYGTILSYATRNNDNAFTITDYTGLVLYVNNKYVVTDIHLNDGMWHHLCVKWSQINGSYEIFVDGERRKYGVNLSTEKQIEGMGYLILGQDQDILGGGFSQSESFVGKLTYVDIWARLLTYEEILIHLKDCNGSFFGDLYPWPIMQDFVQGEVQIEHSTFCRSCDAPKPLYNGYIEVENNSAVYSCYPGFTLNNPSYLKGRKCTKASHWEGQFEPYCKRIYCGYPASIRNGYTIGNRYFYEDKILFKCYEGFFMIGSPIITCKENGVWFPNKPQCIGLEQCQSFEKPEFSNLTVIADQSYEDYKENKTKFDIGTQIEFHCDENYELVGNNTINCLESGTWDSDPPKCTAVVTTTSPNTRCSIEQIPPAPGNGYIDVDSLNAVKKNNATLIEYKCNVGYRLLGDKTTTCILDGYWTEANITCDPITCITTPKFKNMMIVGYEGNNTHYYGDVINFKCDDGYDKLGNLAIRCLASGKWSRIQGKCLRKSCGKPDISDETEIQGRSYLYGDKVTITCTSGSSYILACTKNGLWDGEKDDSC